MKRALLIGLAAAMALHGVAAMAEIVVDPRTRYGVVPGGTDCKGITRTTRQLTPLSAAGDGRASLELACLALNRGDAVEAARLFGLAGEQGDLDALLVIGNATLRGAWGLPADPAAAARWFQMGADRGSPSAKASLANLYSRGLGVPRNLPKALALYREAADGGVVVAAFNLGALYTMGPPEIRDDKEGVRWLLKAADQDMPEAMYDLGVLTEAGRAGGPADKAKAFAWYRRAAELGLADGERAVGLAYLTGNGVRADLAQAVPWLRKAAGKDDPLGLYVMGRLTYEGQGVPQDRAEGIRLLRRAASMGVKEAAAFLAEQGIPAN